MNAGDGFLSLAPTALAVERFKRWARRSWA